MVEPLAYRSTHTLPVRSARRVRQALAIVAAIGIVTNTALALVAWLVPAWGGFIAFFGVLMLNFCLGVVSLGSTGLVGSYAGSTKAHVIASFIFPPVLWIVNVGVVGAIVFPNGIPRC